MSARPRVSVLLPCWNALSLTKVCLAQLARRTPSFELVAVDNGSTDGTWDWLRRWRRARPRPRDVRLLRNGSNRGYAAAMNQALAAAGGELLVFANADAAPGPRWLEEMSALFAARPRLGGLSPCSNPPLRGRPAPWVSPWYHDPAGMARFACARALRSGTPAFVPAAGFIPGFWFMTTRAALRRAGGFDEGFGPGGGEDWDLQWRLREAGYELGFAARAYAHHAWAGVCRLNGVDARRLHARGRRRLAVKHPAAAGARLSLLTPA